MKPTLVELFHHNKWSNLRLLDACAQLNDEQLDASTKGTYGTIRDTLLHLFAAEERYVDLLTAVPSSSPLQSVKRPVQSGHQSSCPTPSKNHHSYARWDNPSGKSAQTRYAKNVHQYGNKQ
jgi:hypothetical protein